MEKTTEYNEIMVSEKMCMAAETGSMYRLMKAAEEYAENSDLGPLRVSSVQVKGQDSIVIRFA